MKCDFYTLTYNNVIIDTSHSKKNLNSLLTKLKQNPKQAKDLIRHKRVINLPDEDDEAQKVINSINQNSTIGAIKWNQAPYKKSF